MKNRVWNSLKIAFAMYSRIPMPASEWTRENKSYAMCFFPWIGGIIGILTWGTYQAGVWLKGAGFPVSDLTVTAALVLIPVLVTGGIHLDGFLDTQDALHAYQPRERRLEILKDPHTGAFAVLAGIVYFVMMFGVYASITEESIRTVSVGFVLSRSLSGLSVVSFPQARKQGMAADFSGSAAQSTTRKVLGAYLVLTVAVMVLAGGIPGAAAVAAAGLCFVYYYRMAIQKFGGMTGDLAGYFLQICELAIAFTAVASDVILKGVGY